MIDKKEIFKYLLEQVQSNNFDQKYALSILTQLKEKINDSESKDIAIIGIGCRLANTYNHDDLWKSIIDKKDYIGDFPKQRRKDLSDYFHKEFNDSSFLKGAYLDEIDKFDADLYKIPPSIAQTMDPYQRLFLEVATESFVDAGYPYSKIHSSNTGVFVGTDHTHKLRTNFLNLFSSTDFSTMTGSWTGLLASRTSYLFNFTGPSMVLDTACSSSMSALSVACNSLEARECSQALVGGINIFFSPFNDGESVNLQVIESIDTKVRPFDRDAQGAIWGEAVCSILIKPLKQAVKDKDNIYAVIKACGVNNDGATNGITAPNPKAQENLLVNTWKKAKIKPENIQYIEAHAIGTVLGDSMEVKGLKSAFEVFTDKKQFCGIGSVKGNYGHTVGASGLLSTIKVALALKNKILPPTINYEHSNPHINFEKSPLYVVTEPTEWTVADKVNRTAAINSYSFNGTNVHLVLEEYVSENETVSNKENIFTLSARTPQLFVKLLKKYISYIELYPDLNIDTICYNQNARRDHFTYRIAFVVDSYNELKKELYGLLEYVEGNNTTLRSAIYSSESFTNILSSTDKYLLEDQIHLLIGNGKLKRTDLNRICELYVQGVSIDWELFYKDANKIKYPVPLMPFKEDRHWPLINETQEFVDVKIIGKSNDQITENEKLIAKVWGEVLGFKEFNINADLYKLGADSVTAMKIANIIDEQLNIKVSLSDILTTPVLSDFALLITNKYSNYTEKKLPAIRESHPILEDYYAVSSPQKRMFYLWHLSNDPTLYNLSIGAPIDKNLSIDKLQNALDRVVQENEIMRTTFHSINDTLYQKIHEKAEFSIIVKEYPDVAIDNLEAINNIMIESISKFNLEQLPLFKLFLLKLKDNKSFVFLDIHHIISDGTSLGLFFKLLTDYYEGNPSYPLSTQYKDYSKWQQDILYNQLAEKEESFWLEQFNDEIPILNLPTDFNVPALQSFEGESIGFKIDDNIKNIIISLAEEYNTTLNIILLSVINILLSKLSSQEDIIVGTPVSGRINRQIDFTMGMFVNTLALRNKPINSKTIKEFILDVKQNALLAYDNQNYQFEDLVDKLDLKRNAARNPLFDVMFQMQNEEFPIPLFECQREMSKFFLTFTAREEDNDLYLMIEYAKALFKPHTINRFFEYISSIITQLINENTFLADISLLNSKEKDLILNVFNNTKTKYPADKSIVQTFQDTVKLYPKQLAVIAKNITYTYSELDSISNQLAHKLAKYIGKGDHVNLIADRSPELIIAILAILKNGAVYIPLDTKYPAEHIQKLIDDSASKLVLVQEKYEHLVDSSVLKIVIRENETFDDSTLDISTTISPSDAAYIMYTSGSTGKPKGVILEHKNIVRLVKNTNYHSFSSEDKISLLAAPSFDASTFEIYGALLNGGTLCLVSEGSIIDPLELKQEFINMGVNCAFMTTSLFNQFVDKFIDVFKDLKSVYTGGEKLSITFSNRLLQHYPDICLYNMYGPTENATYSTFFKIENSYSTDVPIGSPISNSTVYIMDNGMNLCPIGIIGEICVGGDGIAKGYLNQETLTKEKFVDNPFGTGKLYRTGDFGKWLPDGNIHFHGRYDEQLKVRGFRIEIGEVESVILKHPDISIATIIVETNLSGLKDLSCFYQSVGNVPINRDDLRQFIAAKLPEYMVPSYFTQVKEFSLNKNGKIDKTLLKTDKTLIMDQVVLPINDVEENIHSAWSKVLGIAQISTDSNFFHIGGDSIKAIQIASRLQALGITIKVNSIFQYPTIQELALNLELDVLKISQEEVVGEVELTPIQKWFFELKLENKNFFNQGVIIQTEECISTDDLNCIFNKLICHHDILRASFSEKNGCVHQTNKSTEKSNLNIQEFDISQIHAKEEYINEIIKKTHSLININDALIQIVNFKDLKSSRICILIHHLIIDGVSWRILLEDFFQALTCLKNREEIKLLPKTTSLKEWSHSLVTYAQNLKETKILSYWIDLVRKTAMLDANIWKPINSASKSITTKNYRYTLDSKTTQQLLQEVNKAYNTEINDILLTALVLSTKDWTSKNSLLVNLEGHGREDIIKGLDVTRTIGWFTSSYPVLLTIDRDSSLSQTIKDIKDNIRAIPNKGVDYGILRYLSKDLAISKQIENINPKVSFNYLGQFDASSPSSKNSTTFLPLGMAPNNNRLYNVDINGIVSEGRLHLDTNYSIDEFSEKDIHEFIGLYDKNLKSIIQHCMNKKDTEYTLADYTSKDIDNTELDNILDELGFD